MGQLEELQNHRLGVMGNIEKSFGTGFDLNDEFEKARSGVYADNAVNRKLNRVGQKYGSEKKPDEPKGGSKQPSKEEQQGSYQKMATEASDKALKRAAADENGDPKVRKMAQDELQKRGGGKDEGGSEKLTLEEKIERLKKNGDPWASESTVQYKERQDKEMNQKFGKRFGITFDAFKEDGENSIEIQAGNQFMFSNIDSYLSGQKGYNEKELGDLIREDYQKYHHKTYKPIIENMIENGDISDEERESLKTLLSSLSKRNRTGKASSDSLKKLENSLSLEFGKPKSKEAKEAMNKVRSTANEFLKKNPKTKISDDVWDAIAEGVEDEYEEFLELDGFKELNDAIEEYVDVAGSEDDED